MDQATLMDKIKTGTTLCKAIMRNGYDAYAINAPLQGLIFEKTGVFDVDIACACDTETLFKIFPNAVPYTEEGAMAMLQENGVTLRFYSTDVEDASHPEMSQLRITPRLARLLAELQLKGQLKSSNTNDPEAKEFEDFDKAGSVKLVGLPSKTLAKNYLLAIRALRYAANFDLPVNPHTWVSIIQSANRILDYVPAREIMEEWRKAISEEMVKVRRELTSTLMEYQKQRQLATYVYLRAPCEAVVHEIASFSEGSAVREAEALVTLVPIDAGIELEAEIAPKDIGRIHKGAQARIKLNSFPFQKHGTLEGEVVDISEDTLQKQEQGGNRAYYRAKMTVSGKLKNITEKFRLIPGMETQCEIKVGRRRVIEYIIHPLIKSLDEAIREP